jgi:hypothetical protein
MFKSFGNKNTGVTSGVSPVLSEIGVVQYIVFKVVFDGPLLFFLSFVLSFLRFTDSVYSIGLFNLFLYSNHSLGSRSG